MATTKTLNGPVTPPCTECDGSELCKWCKGSGDCADCNHPDHVSSEPCVTCGEFCNDICSTCAVGNYCCGNGDCLKCGGGGSCADCKGLG